MAFIKSKGLNTLFGSLRKGLKIIGQRAFVFYILVFILANMIFDCELILRRARFKALDRLRPDEFSYLIEVEKGNPVDREKLEEYRDYYERIIINVLSHLSGFEKKSF